MMGRKIVLAEDYNAGLLACNAAPEADNAPLSGGDVKPDADNVMLWGRNVAPEADNASLKGGNVTPEADIDTLWGGNVTILDRCRVRSHALRTGGVPLITMLTVSRDVAPLQGALLTRIIPGSATPG